MQDEQKERLEKQMKELAAEQAIARMHHTEAESLAEKNKAQAEALERRRSEVQDREAAFRDTLRAFEEQQRRAQAAAEERTEELRQQESRLKAREAELRALEETSQTDLKLAQKKASHSLDSSPSDCMRLKHWVLHNKSLK